MQTYSLMTYNLFEGAAATYEQLIGFVKAEHIDLLCLQEVNGWHEQSSERLADFAARCNLPYYTFGDSNTTFKLATFSRLPIKRQKVYTEGFWHSVIETEVKLASETLTIYNLHLNPQWEGPRVEEVKRLLTLIDTSRPVLLVGDFNSLSRQDNYPQTILGELQSHHITKFGRDALEFSVTSMLESAGLIDVAARFNRMDSTVPSGFNQDKNHEVAMRLDYIFASRAALKGVVAIEVVKNEATNTISDHYPIRALLQLS
jgi:exodeoxyribonuclease-3